MDNNFKELIEMIKNEEMSDGEKYMSIGRLADLTGVSIRRIRHYCDRGLIAPDFIDAVTGYRYFGYMQITNILLINELRDLGFSLDQIGTMIKDLQADKSLTLFDEHLGALDKEIDVLKRKRDRLTSLKSYIEWSQSIKTSDSAVEIKVEDMPERYYAIQEVAEDFINGLAFKKAFEIITMKLEEHNLTHLDSYGALYEEVASKRMGQMSMRYTVEVDSEGVKSLRGGKNITEGSDITDCLTLEAGKYLSLLYKGDYDAFYKEAYPTLQTFVKENKLIVEGPYLEIYHLTRPFEAFGMLTEIQVKLT